MDRPFSYLDCVSNRECHFVHVSYIMDARSDGVTTYGYARYSTDESRQDIDRQRRELHEMGADDPHIYWEYELGSRRNRPEFTKLLTILQPRDTLAVTEVSRLTRSTAQRCEVIDLARTYGLRFVIGSFVVDCTGETIAPATKAMLMMWRRVRGNGARHDARKRTPCGPSENNGGGICASLWGHEKHSVQILTAH